jgi:hypothetical protein
MPSSRERSLVFRWPVRYRVSLAAVTALVGVLLLGASGQLLVIMIGGNGCP